MVTNLTFPSGDNGTFPSGDNAVWQTTVLSSTCSVYDVRANTQAQDNSICDVSQIMRSSDASKFNIYFRYRGSDLSVFDIASTVQSRDVSVSNAFVDKGWMLYARDVSTGTITQLGFIQSGYTTLAASVSDGIYDVEARPWGNYWDDCRTARVLRVEISGGDVVAPIPVPVRRLWAEDLTKRGRDIYWNWVETYGASDPHDFALWFSDTSPVSTSGTPDATQDAKGAGVCHMYRYAQAEAKYVAVCARDSSENKGEVSELLLDYPGGAISGPDIQWGMSNE